MGVGNALVRWRMNRRGIHLRIFPQPLAAWQRTSWESDSWAWGEKFSWHTDWPEQ